RDAVLSAEGAKHSDTRTDEGERQSARRRAERATQSALLRPEGESRAIDTVFAAIHEGRPDPERLSYQYLQMLPQLARGEANKIFVIPSEFTQALSNLGGVLGRGGNSPPAPPAPPAPPGGPPA